MTAPTTTTTGGREAAAQAERVPHRWRNLTTLTAVSAVDNTEGSAISTLFPTIATALTLNTGALGVLSALGKIVAVPTGPAWVALAARIGRKPTLVLTSVAGGVFGIAAGFSQNFGMLLLFTALMSASVIGASPIANAVIADSFEDRERGTAAGLFYGVLNVFASVIGPVIALFTLFSDGWRVGLWVLGAVCIVGSLIVLAFFRDPGVGAAEKQLADLNEQARTAQRVTFRSVLGLFRIPTYTVMMVSRLLSGHLLINIFGVTFLVAVRGFDNATAAIVLLPFGVGYAVATFGGGFLLRLVDRVAPNRGRVAYLQLAQVFFAIVAFLATQFDYGAIGAYAVFWALMGLGQGLNPPVNRPIVAAVVAPELRGQAFAVWLTIFETIGWALFAIVAGQLAVAIGLQSILLVVLVVLMLVNAAVLTVLYFTYPRDVRRLNEQLEQRRTAALDGR